MTIVTDLLAVPVGRAAPIRDTHAEAVDAAVLVAVTEEERPGLALVTAGASDKLLRRGRSHGGQRWPLVLDMIGVIRHTVQSIHGHLKIGTCA